MGDRRIGVATGDDALGLVRPLPTLRRSSNERTLAELGAIAAREGAEALLVGLPLTLQGTEGVQAARVRRFADACAALGLPVALEDERFTTAEAQARGASDPDAGAAVVLLEDFFSRRRRG